MPINPELNPNNLPKPTPEQFVEIYNASENNKDAERRFAAAGLYISYGSMVQRAKKYKAKGVKLKDLAKLPTGRRTDVEALNRLLEAQSNNDEVSNTEGAEGE